MTDQKQKPGKNMDALSAAFFKRFLFALLSVVLAVWFIAQSQQSLNMDTAYLTLSALKSLAGQKMSEAYYDTNPPMSFLVYLPPALFVEYLNVPIYYGVFGYACILIALSSLALFYVLKASPQLSEDERTLILCIHLLCNTLAVGHLLGERDQFIALSLLPFVFLQLALTQRVHIHRVLKWGIIVAVSVFILLKPHYGLIPLIFFIHRMIRQKRLNVFFDADFIGLASGSLAYSAIVFYFYPDFIYVIAPDAVNIYALSINDIVLVALQEYGLALFVTVTACWLLFDKPYKNALILLGIAGVCLFLYTIQGKGFNYHLIPFLVFFSCGISLMLYQLFAQYFESVIWKHAALLAVLIFVGFNLYYKLLPQRPFLTHDQYKHSALAMALKTCQGDCSFFMFHDMLDMIPELSVYAQQPHASRFPCFFFLPSLISSKSAIPEDERQRLADKYLSMVADDFTIYEPDTLVIGRYEIENGMGFMDFLRHENPRFEAIFENYYLDDSLVIDQNVYTGGIVVHAQEVTYDIYRKKTQKVDQNDR